MSGIRTKSSGTTMVTSPARKALVSARCDASPHIAMPVSAGRSPTPSRVTNVRSLPATAIGSCMTFIQNRMASVVVVAVSVFGTVNATAKPNAAASTRSAAGWNVARPGRRITSTPTDPSTSTPIRLGVRRSPSSSTASSATHAGAVNSIANTAASGSSVTLRAHEYCAAKYTVFRSTWSAIRRGTTSPRKSGRRAISPSRTATPDALRIARISKMLSAPASARIDSAMVQNASIARVIHRTTGTMLDGGAAMPLFENRATVVTRIDDDGARRDGAEILRDLPAQRFERPTLVALARGEQRPRLVLRRRGDDHGTDEVVLRDPLEEVERHGSLRSGRLSASADHSAQAFRLNSIARSHSSSG